MKNEIPTHTEMKLELGQEELKRVLDSITESIYGVDLNGDCTFCNASFLKTLGYKSDEGILGRNIHQLIHHHHADGTLYTNETCLIYTALKKGEGTRSDQEVFWRADGTSFPVEYWSYPQYRNGEIVGNVVTFFDITARKKIELREQLRSEILELMYKGAPLSSILDTMVLGFEHENKGMICSVLILDKEGKHLLRGSAPSLPEFYSKAIEGIEIGEGVGSCGTSAFTGKRVIVENIKTHPYWKEFQELTGKAGLASCWSEPVKDAKEKVLGSFAIYHRQPTIPSEEELELIKQNADLAALIIEHFKASQNLVESENKYRSLVENSPDIIFTINLDGIIQFINHTIARYAKEQVVGISVFDFVSAENKLIVKQALDKVIETKTTQVYEINETDSDGNLICYLTHAVPVFSANEVVGITLIVRDISARKKNEEALATSFSLLEATLESTADGIMVVDNSGKIVRFNKKFSELWRIPPEVLESKDDAKALAFVLDQLANPESFIAKVKELYAQPSMVSFDVLEFKDGRTFERYSQPQTIKDKYVGRVWSFRDITERKIAEEVLRKSELRYQSLTTVAPVGIFHTDANGDTAYVNPSWSQITGLTSEEALGHNWLNAVHEKDKKAIISGWNKAVKMQEISFSEFRFVRPDGSIAWVMGQAIPERNADNKVVGYVGTITDITERKKSEEEKTRLLNTIQKSLDEIYLFNTENFRFEYANGGALKNIGYTKEEILKLTPLDIKPELTLEKVNKLVAPLLNNEKEKIVFETTHKRKDGSLYPVEVHMQLILEGEKKVFLTITRDITERKKADEELKESERFLKETQLIANLGTYSLDIATGNWIASEMLENILGIEPNFEKTFEGGQAIIHPEWRKIMADYFLEEVLGKKKKFDIEYKIIRPNDKAERWVHGIGDLKFNENNQPVTLVATVQDITESKQAAEQIIEKSIQLELLSDNLPGTVMYQLAVSPEREMIFTYLSKSVERLTGKTAQEFMQNPLMLYHMVLEEDRQIMYEAAESAFLNRKQLDVDVRYYNSLNELRWLHIRAVPRKNVEENMIWDGVNTDITEQKKTEEEVKQSEEKYRQIVETAQEGILVIDETNKTSFVNQRMADMLGYEKEEMIGKTLFDFMDDEGRKITEQYVERRKQGISEEFEFKFQKKNGDDLFTLIMTNPIIVDNTYKGALAMIMDITNKKLVEREIMLLMNNTEENFVLVDTSFNIVSFNQQFKSIYSRFFGKEVKAGDSILNYVQPGRLEIVRNIYKRVFNGERLETEINVPLGDKIHLAFLNRYKPNYDQKGNIVGAFVTSIDITDRKKAEEEVIKSKNELRHLTAHLEHIREEEGARIAREIHDELGQQLTSLKMDAAWISKKAGLTDGAVKEKVDDMLHLIDETVKTVRRIASALRPGILDDLGLNATLEWQCNEFAKRAEIKCKFKSKFNDDNIDKNTATGIFRVCQEALNNIARYAKATEVKITIEQDQEYILLTIKDNGSGFNVDEIKSKNTLGIVGMRERAIMLGGVLTIKSEKNKGTNLILRVPMKTV